MTDLVKNAYNEYHRNYYNTKVDKSKRKEEFKAYYVKNKQEISDKRRAQRSAKKQQAIVVDQPVVLV